MLLYLAGPMSGITDHNYPAFRDAAYQLRSLGFSVLSPAELGLDSYTEEQWRVALRRSLRQMLEAEGVATLVGWQHSKGAKLECELADKLGIPVKGWGVWRQLAPVLVTPPPGC